MLHFHHHAVDACTDAHLDWPEWALTVLATLDRRELQLMAAIQDSIDALTARVASIEADVVANAAQPAADLSGLTAAIDNLRSAVPAQSVIPAPAADPAPEQAPAADATDPAPADVPAQPALSIPSVPLA